MKEDNKLLPCPFCGAPAGEHCYPGLVRCSNEGRPHCPASFGCVEPEHWNRRTPPPVPASSPPSPDPTPGDMELFPHGKIVSFSPDGKPITSYSRWVYEVTRRREWSDPADGDPPGPSPALDLDFLRALIVQCDSIIQDGDKLGASAWRNGLGFIKRGAEAALRRPSAPTPPAPAPWKWNTSRKDMQSYTGDGAPVCFLYPPDDKADRIPILGPNCRAIAERLAAELNGTAKPPLPPEDSGYLVSLPDSETLPREEGKA